LRHFAPNVIYLGHDSKAVERKSVSVDQYCRYPPNSLISLSLRTPGSRDLRFRHTRAPGETMGWPAQQDAMAPDCFADIIEVVVIRLKRSSGSNR